MAFLDTLDQVIDTVSGQTRTLIKLIKTAILPTQQQQLVRAANSSSGSGPSAIATNLTIPPAAAVLTFDFRFSQPGNGDWVTVSFNDTLLFSFLGSSFVGSDYQHIQIPVGNIAGQTGVLTVVLNEAGSQDAEVLVSNFQFLSNNRGVSNDVDGDGKADLVWHHRTLGQVYVWLMNGLTAQNGGSPGTVPNLSWEIQ
jgi:hypothetical protein